MSKKDWRIRLEHILACIDHIVEKTADMQDEEDFENNLDVKRIVERNIEIISEASQSIPDDVKAEFSEIPWSKIVAARNRIVHAYHSVDEDALWNVVQNHIQSLQETALKMQEKYGKAE